MRDFDPDLTWKPVAERLARTTNPRHRLMLQRLLDHAQGEVEGDLERVMGTLAPNPVYHMWSGGPAMSPSGSEATRQFYIDEIFGKGRHVFESGKYRIVVDDETIVTEGFIKSLAYGRDMAEAGRPVEDVDAVYLTTVRMLVVWPFDADGYITGEESWAVPCGVPVRKLDWAEVPPNYQAYVLRRNAMAA